MRRETHYTNSIKLIPCLFLSGCISVSTVDIVTVSVSDSKVLSPEVQLKDACKILFALREVNTIIKVPQECLGAND